MDQEKMATQEDKMKVFCWGIKCPHLKDFTDDEGEWATCTATSGCIYSKEFINKWYEDNKCNRKEMVRHLITESGEFKKVVRASTGVAYKVPTRDIIEKGIRAQDLDQYPKWED